MLALRLIHIFQFGVQLIEIAKRDKKLNGAKHIVSSQDSAVAGLLCGTNRLGEVIGVKVLRKLQCTVVKQDVARRLVIQVASSGLKLVFGMYLYILNTVILCVYSQGLGSLPSFHGDSEYGFMCFHSASKLS